MGTWITCEEDRTTGHGYAFEVDPAELESNVSKTPIRAMGFFSHEAIDIAPRTGIAYLTEDDFRGSQPAPELEVPGTTRSSFLYRYLPDNRAQRPGALQGGGRLQATAIQAGPLYNMDLGRTGERFQGVWSMSAPRSRTMMRWPRAPRAFSAWRAATSPAARSGSMTRPVVRRASVRSFG